MEKSLHPDWTDKQIARTVRKILLHDSSFQVSRPGQYFFMLHDRSTFFS
jgi:hypothetical protein